MNQDSAFNLINDTFNHPFKEENFYKFSINFLNDINISQNSIWQNNEKLSNTIKDKIIEYKILGHLDYENGEKIIVAIAKLKSSKVVEKSRQIQRELAKYILDVNNADACLISFFAENYDDWRFSLVRQEYNRQITEKGKIQIKKIFSPVKRYSYLVGKNEPNNTAKSQLAPLLLNRNKLSIDEIEKAFSLEKLTKEFFEKYKYLCFKITDELKYLRKMNTNIDKDFNKHFLKEIDFAKKFMGQIIFLYFIQKKGWMGVTRNNEGFFSKWGSGPKNFLRKLFNKEYCDYKNFFNDIMEDLLYVGLSVDHPDNYYPKLNCKLPFLNGGLFEPINDYNWKETDITIKNETIKEIFDVFDAFNFTINEEDSLEKEVAIDPETLGKVFENLLDENLQRGHGVFYTPRKIVDYMCICSISSFLKRNLNNKIQYVDLKNGINEILQIEIQTEKYLEKFTKNTTIILKNYSNEIDSLLKNVRICDPAIGSGAFPVSMMNIIVKIRKSMKLLKNQNLENIDYNLKYQFIKRNIFGVDIDKSAVDIAKLRLWLSLIIDEENYEKINTLPNLDYKILQGNSLFDDFGGEIDFSKNKQETFDSFFSEKESLIEEYFKKIKEYDLLNNQIDKKMREKKLVIY